MAERFKRDKSIYDNYVCPKCFYTMDKCTCDVFPNYHITWIDKGIQEHVRILNEKGYRTQFSCESHTPGGNMYIMFCNNSFADYVPIPDGFKHIKSNKIIEHKYDRKISDSEFQEQKGKHLDILLQWCKSLPNLNN